MGDGTYYWIMQTIKGATIAHGPYLTEQARDNRMEKIMGGEVIPFRNLEPDRQRAIQEFQLESIR